MSRSLEETLVAFSEKYEGNFEKILKAVVYKERLTDKEIKEDQLNGEIFYVHGLEIQYC